MTNLHMNDKLAGLDWALNRARESAARDELIRLTYRPALQQLRDQAQRETRGG
ncbi:UNVERIFIED_ORG: hypothetical protein GGR78_000580 [Xanthomonas campestris]